MFFGPAEQQFFILLLVLFFSLLPNSLVEPPVGRGQKQSKETEGLSSQVDARLPIGPNA